MNERNYEWKNEWKKLSIKTKYLNHINYEWKQK